VSEWTIEQAAELLLEQVLDLLDGADDDDVVRPEMVLKAVNQVWSPGHIVDWPEMTARELREAMREKRSALAGGEKIP